ncbi:MAG: outer membrane beta-barrel protein [Saprospiraceae bacterium]|nr:outer membrane beta-barrel protein [Saprospiraceae bacterium]
MKKTGFLFLLAIAAWPSFAQQSFGWGINLYPNISNRRLIAYSSITDEMIRAIEKREGSKPSYAAHLFLAWRSEKAGFQVGAGFADAGYRTVEEAIPADDPDFANASSRRFVFRNYNLEIPASLKFYQSLSDKDYFTFMLGANLSYNLANDTLTVLYDGETSATRSVKDESDFRKINYAFTTGLGWEHQFSPTFTLILQPTFTFWMKALFKETEFTELNRNLYSFGVSVGFRFDREAP